ncbi:N-acetylglucosamine-1-phosphodiester alpha-N-acetylglucosaminidase-like isoform X2 [Acanthopagrus latus]|nr:N-acetylglucosamine-1-phosphodiester alpha-N-acetylglucosaminidase-like isoform X2 [Acanthopagrus latus]XP_036930222.1 N-acetylglucosamine-1-phosphodiester alpha-N-acetylglucosaminidase-like isoform X2 [Acanthopagrus latus]
MALVHDPLRTLSVMEPGGPGGCEKSRRATVEETAAAAGCLYAQNAGFFNTINDQCVGNVVSDGRRVRDSGGVQNAQFGIRKDGSLVFGYLSQEEVLDRSNPFVQLVSGVVWLLRNGEVYINQSLKAECNKMVDQEVFRDFVDVLSARTVVGHDADGNLVLFHVEGKTLERGMNLWEVAQFLKKHGVINAINLDGGGSSSFVINGTLVSYPPDPCKSDSRWCCARPVSTILCVHPRRCQPANCSGHGDCVDGRCRCQDGWQGAACDSLVCRPPACGPHGVCTADGCVCAAGWRGKNCRQECSPGYYGDGCRHTCVCFNGAHCHHVSGRCTCPPGFHGNLCEQVCPPGLYGLSCAERCQCGDQCPCDPRTGSCSSLSGGRLTGGVYSSTAGQCLAKQMFALWRQQEEAHRDEPYLSERAWLMITVTLASLLLIPLVVRLIVASWRRLIFSYSYRKVQRATSTEKHCLSECLIFTDNTRGSARQM